VSGLFILAAKEKAANGLTTQRTTAMTEQISNTKKKTAILSLDAWAVIVALLLAALVRFGVLKHISW